jgi:dTDP-4-dehydrorhamnose reductase
MKLVVLGSGGMMGSMLMYVAKKRNIHVQGISRHEFNVLHHTIDDLFTLIHCDSHICIVNCIGCIPQKAYTNDEYALINEKFPHILSDFCKKNSYFLIHMSTNCVFSGKKDMCSELDLCDADDVYGKTKYLGEPSYGIVLRSSIIGLERSSSFGLLSWFLNHSQPKVNGFLHQYWNGVTTYELSTYICDSLLDSTDSKRIHIYSKNTVSKYELLRMSKDIFTKNIEIQPFVCAIKYYTLSSIHISARKDIKEQLQDLLFIYSDFMSNM